MIKIVSLPILKEVYSTVTLPKNSNPLGVSIDKGKLVLVATVDTEATETEEILISVRVVGQEYHKNESISRLKVLGSVRMEPLQYFVFKVDTFGDDEAELVEEKELKKLE